MTLLLNVGRLSLMCTRGSRAKCDDSTTECGPIVINVYKRF